MMSDLGLALLAAAACLGFLLFAVRRRWFSRIDHGFLVVLILVFFGVGLATAGGFGIWGYETSRTILFQEIVDGLATVGGVIEGEVHRELGWAARELTALAKIVTPEMARANPRHAEEKLQDIQRFNTELLQVSLLDRDGNPIVSSSRTGVGEPVNRIAVGFNLEGKPFTSHPYVSPVFQKHVIYLSVPVFGADGKVSGAFSLRYDLQEEFGGLVASTRFGQTGYTTLTDHEGRILAHPDPARISEDISQYPAVQAAAQGRTGWVVARNQAGQERLMVYRPVKTPATLADKPWVLLTEIDSREALAPIRDLRYHFALGILAVVAVCLAVAQQVSRSVTRPLHDLEPVLRRIREGDLTGPAAPEGRDELGQLGTAINDMARGLQERERIKDLFGRYVTTQVSEELLKGQVHLGGRTQRVTILFSDIRNFTTMSETMTAEQVVSFLNDYFSEMVDAVFEHGGVLDKFIGDGIMAVFGALGDTDDHARRTVRTALRMKALLAKINGERASAGQPPIGIGIGIHTDDVVVGNIGSRKRLQYTVIGDGVNTCARVESANKSFGTTILITETTLAELGDEFECRAMPETELKGKTRVPRLFEVLSARAPGRGVTAGPLGSGSAGGPGARPA